ncbi:MAG: (Fe-S)-binding protein, partial [Bacteroidales bacterium]
MKMALPGKKNEVNLFIPCCMDMFNPLIPNSVISVLERLGDSCVYNVAQTCCGRRFYVEGEIELAKELGEKLMSEFNVHLPMIVPTT